MPYPMAACRGKISTQKPFVPTDLAGLVLWLKADAGTFQDAAGTTPATAHLAPVGLWQDQSGTGNHISQSTSGNRGALYSNLLNGLPGVRLGGTAFLQGALTGALSQPYTVIAVARIEAIMVNLATATLVDGDDSTNRARLEAITGTPPRWRMNAGANLAGAVATVNPNWHVFTATYNGNSSALRTDGADDASGAAGANALDGITVGGNYAGSAILGGLVGEVLVYSGALSAPSVQAVENYLATRWGLSLPYGSAFALADPTTLFDNGYNVASGTGNYYRTSSPFARWVFDTDAAHAYISAVTTAFSLFPGYAHIGVIVDGASYATLSFINTSNQVFRVALPSGTKRVELVAGLQSKPAAAVLGTFLQSVTFSVGTTTLVEPTAPANRVVVYGDSIAVGDGSLYPTSQAWPVLLRADLPVAVEAWGYRSLYDDANTAELRAALVAQLASFAPGAVWLAIGTNDYGLNKWAAAAFGAAYAALLDDLHTALPDATIYCQTPLLRGTETANGSGSTLGDYRTQIATAQSTRTDWAVLVDGTAMLELTDLSADQIHPTTAGHALYAAAVATALGL